MFFSLAIIVLFVAISIYLFFRTERLQQDLNKTKKENHVTQKENKALVDAMVLIAGRNEEFAKYRLQRLKDDSYGDKEHGKNIKLLTPLINNYAFIFRECLKGKGQLSVATKKCYDKGDPELFREFNAYINSQQEANIKRLWNNNSLSGFISLVEALLTTLEKSTSEEIKSA